ncbi:LacI family DNA-binding transcriptional regulator [Domibacillus sp. A3M-37]|uniref:LacI family DNA-binding transcriptional regulator n=1 Tax=Domibacillus sp. A3M-37 TaxID=2962037 RepID=UPI0020B7A9E3|nr:LacI family DNA-binding transcriptional regulator [Domibacillus sp. A3M-37]MCP3763519.1 LacI family DNA-binding transcriptional regulator [Domibacillus sp. A3M-37]
MKTIADIAKIAGVAKSTVSRYLNGGSVSEETKKKIELVIEETGYAPNAFAQSLKAKKTNIIGTIIPRLDSYATSRTLMGIDERLRELNYHMLVLNTGQNLKREIENIYTLAKQKVAGIILLATEVTDAHLKAFQEIDIPVLLVGQQHDDVYSLVHDDETAGYAIGKYIAQRGHKKIAFLGVGEYDVAVGLKRKKGFAQAVSEHTADVEARFFETTFSMSDAAEQARQLFDEFSPSAVVCATDNIAIGAVKAAYQKKLRVPEDVSITGFGGYEVTAMMNPSLTTVHIYFTEAGHTAANHIVKLVKGEEVPRLAYSRFEIILRESVDIRTNHLL